MPQFVRALLIEPEPERRARLSGALSQATIKTTPVDSLTSALLRCEVERFDCILLSMTLPEGRGPAIVLRARQVIPPVPLIAIGERPDPSMELLALRAGAEEFVGMTAVEQDLAGSVRRVLARAGADEGRRKTHNAVRNVALGQVAAAVAHEINNPLASISTNTAVLRTYVEDVVEALADLQQSGASEEWLDAWRERYDLDRALDDARQICIDNALGLRRVGAVVHDLSRFARPARETRRSVDVNSLLERAYWDLEGELRDRATVDWQLEAVPRLMGEANQLRSVFVHLLRNALQALDTDTGQDHRVTIATWAKDGEVQISITDTGCGVPLAARPRVFEPFFSTRDAGEGAGLGLAVCEQIITRHGGEISLEGLGRSGARSLVRVPAINTRGAMEMNPFERSWEVSRKPQKSADRPSADGHAPSHLSRPRRRRSQA